MNKHCVRVLCGMLVFFLLSSTGYAQPWMRNIEKNDPNFYEIQQEFEEYWQDRDPEKGKGWKQFKRWEWFMESRVDENGRLDAMSLWKGWQEKEELFRDKSTREDDHWTVLGPEAQVPINGGAGRLNCIAFDPGDSDIIWVGAASGGLWKSIDGGESWSTTTDHLPVLGVSAILIHPTDSDIMYIGTGDGDGGSTYSVGVLKSTDGGETWELTGLNWEVFEGTLINKLKMHPENPDIIFAATNDGIFKTLDAGETWEQKTSGNYKDLKVDPHNHSIWFGARVSSGIYRTVDSGDTWSQLIQGLPGGGYGRIALAICPSTEPAMIYALFASNSGGFYGVYRSQDLGDTWTVRATSPNLLGWQADGSDSGGQGFYDLTIGVSPSDPNVVYVGGVNQWKSTNGGSSWNLMSHWYGNGAPYVHADHHAFQFLPEDDDAIFSGNDGGFFKSTNAGDSWTDLSEGLGVHQIYRMGASLTDPSLMYCGTQDNGTSRRNATGWAQVIGGDGMECLVDYSNSNIGYGSIYFGNFYRTTNGGETFQAINNGVAENGGWVTPFIIDPENPLTLYRTTTRVYKSTNRGGIWTPISPPFTGMLVSLAIAPSDPNVLYTSHRESMYRTTNGGEEWGILHGAPPGIGYITVHPYDPMTAWVVYGGYNPDRKIYKTTDLGETWFSQRGDLPNVPINCSAVDPEMPDHIYIGTDLGVFFSPNSGESWIEFGGGLPNVIVNELEVHTPSSKIRAATYGRGIWESPLNKGAVAGSVTLAGSDDHSGVRIFLSEYPFISTLTHGDGGFSLDPTPTGSYTIIARKPGYQFGEVSDVTVDFLAATPNINFTLEQSGPAPFDLNALSDYSDIVPLTWQPPIDASPSSYAIYRSQLEDGPFTLIHEGESEIAYNDVMVENYAVYYYRVTAIYDNPAGESEFSNESIASPGPVMDFPFYASFEQNDGDFQVVTIRAGEGDVWEWGTPSDGPDEGYASDRCWGTGISGSYAVDCETRLATPKIDLTSMASPETAYLSFHSWWDIQAQTGFGIDGGRVVISIDGGETWEVAVPIGGYPYENILVFDTGPGISGVSDGWEQINFDLSPYLGEKVRIGFQFISDASVQNSGWFIDEISVHSSLPVQDEDQSNATVFALHQNRPNPFNPVTTISFSIPKASMVQLKIYDVTGREIKTLLDEKRDAGTHHIEFSCGNLPSGAYLYQLETPDKKATRRMTLLK
ncbi:MAG: hypothetical protein B6244_09990 [Candidatus Cloacimonetes bacterium 4572_55]|nr:MAG: hypothetical protein B6244_09990 [Candidatus Cloacimonetes bacterium 4572_55]